VPEKKEKSTKPKEPERDKTFGCPDWVEDNVLPLEERGAKLWRSLCATHGGDKVGLKFNWEKFAPDVKNWDELPVE